MSTVDYPGHLSAIIFCQGCPWRCAYCHNPHLLPKNFSSNEQIPWSRIKSFLQRRQGLLDAVVFSGGEPLIQANIHSAMRQLDEMGFQIALHTGGVSSWRLQKLIPRLSWVGLDIKTLADQYDAITGAKNSGREAWNCVSALVDSEVNFECRTSVHPDYHSLTTIWQLANTLRSKGVKSFALQRLKRVNNLKSLSTRWYDDELFQELITRLEQLFPYFYYRT